MARIEMYSSRFCPYCMMAQRLLSAKGAQYVTYDVDSGREVREQMQTRSGRRTVPQIFIDDRHIGGYDDLAALDAQGGLDPLLDG